MNLRYIQTLSGFGFPLAGFCVSLLQLPLSAPAAALDLAGLTVTPHIQMDSLRYARKPEPPEGARVQLFLHHRTAADNQPLDIRADSPLRFNDRSPDELLKRRAWAWHDTPAALPGAGYQLPHDALTVWTFNGQKLPRGSGRAHRPRIRSAGKPMAGHQPHARRPEGLDFRRHLPRAGERAATRLDDRPSRQ